MPISTPPAPKPSTKTAAPYGTWRSPITSAAIVATGIGLSDLTLLESCVWWQESRPSEKGRSTVVCRHADGSEAEATPAPFNVRTRVHEYGGRCHLATDAVVFFVHFADQRLYRIDAGQAPRAITPEALPAAALRYADLAYCAEREQLYAVREDHRGKGECVNTLVVINAMGDAHGGQVLASGCDFYAAPRLSPNGRHLAWVQWRHPNMPWDGTELCLATLGDDGQATATAVIAGGPNTSVLQPLWSPDGVLHYVSDESGWWNLYAWASAPGATLGWGQAQALCPMEAEFAVPLWNFGTATYGFDDAGHIVCCYQQNGRSHLGLLERRSLRFTPVHSPYTAISSLQVLGSRAVFVGGSPTTEPSVCEWNLRTAAMAVLKRGSSQTVVTEDTSEPEALAYVSAQGRSAHAWFYPPQNAQFEGTPGEKPPLVVMIHGGPTSAAVAVYKTAVQFWTSRGFAVVDVNYGGSTGYGRGYRERLNGQWGVVDVEDCCAAAQALVAQGKVDGARLIIRGGSAGGYTTLAALAFHQVFRCGASLYGIGDLAALAQDTHKFESRYLDSLIGPYPAEAERYRARSPLFHTEGLNCPLILFQGSDDLAVPPEQSRRMFEAVKAKGLPVAYVEFAGEGHGFRQAANIRRALDAELTFYARVFGMTLPGPVEPLEIANL